MTLNQQILWGGLFLGACLAVQIVSMILCSGVLDRLARRYKTRSPWVYLSVMVGATLVFIVLSHTVQVWIWALAWMSTGVHDDWNTAIYFSLVTYSTVGYGDVTLGPPLRIFGAFGGVTGVLAFGVSTAFLVSVMNSIMKERGFSED
jgi:hypothetical protein